jgi:hypothetical protein
MTTRATAFLVSALALLPCACDGGGGKADPHNEVDAGGTAKATIEVTEIVGDLHQGSGVGLTIVNHDPAHPFDLTLDDSSNMLANLEVIAPDGIHAWEIYDFEATETELRVSLDFAVDAPTGAIDLALRNGPPGTPTIPLPAAFEIIAREPADLAAGTPVSVSLALRETALYRLSVAERSIILLSITATGPGHSRIINMLTGPSGDFADRRTSRSDGGTVIADHAFLWLMGVPLDADGEPAEGVEAGYEVGYRTIPVGDATATETATANDDRASAQAVPVPATITGTLSFEGESVESDWYQFTVGSADAGRPLAVHLRAEGFFFLPVFEVQAADGTVVMRDDQSAFDLDYHQTVVGPPLAAGTYFIRVGDGQGEGGPYELTLGLAARP